jgi:MFS transporter, DHA2 family, methylenomycin A resistance protein
MRRWPSSRPPTPPSSRPPARPSASPPLPIGLLLAVFLGTFMALLDVSIVSVALPAMQRGLHVSVAALQWVVDAYTLCLSALVLSGGSLGDRYGRKRLFLGGIGGFAVGSAICAMSASYPMLVAGRVGQGIAAAALMPGALSILGHSFPEPRQRARVIGLWGACSGLALVAGPLLGGLLVDAASWPWIFVINVPLGVIALLTGWRCIPESADPSHASVDPAGQLLGVAWLGALAFGFIEAGDGGWASPAAVLAFAASAVAFAAFVAAELRSSAPMLPIRLFADARFSLVNAASFVMGFSAFATFVILSLFLQDLQRDSALVTGLHYLPLCLGEVLTAPIGARITASRGPRLPIVIGYAVMGASLLAMTTFSAATGGIWLSVVLALLGIGMGLGLPPVNVAAMAAVPRERSGVASATTNAVRQTGTTLGIALLGAILTTRATQRLATSLAAAGTAPRIAHQTAIQAVTLHAFRAGAPVHASAAVLAHFYGLAFSSGFRLAMTVAGLTSLALAVAARGLGPSRKLASIPASQPERLLDHRP